jgi:hypothetical protein
LAKLAAVAATFFTVHAGAVSAQTESPPRHRDPDRHT